MPISKLSSTVYSSLVQRKLQIENQLKVFNQQFIIDLQSELKEINASLESIKRDGTLSTKIDAPSDVKLTAEFIK